MKTGDTDKEKLVQNLLSTSHALRLASLNHLLTMDPTSHIIKIMLSIESSPCTLEYETKKINNISRLESHIHTCDDLPLFTNFLLGQFWVRLTTIHKPIIQLLQQIKDYDLTPSINQFIQLSLDGPNNPRLKDIYQKDTQ